MGLLGNDDNGSSEEVKISASVEEDESELMNEVESKFGGSSSSNEAKIKDTSSSSVDLEDLHRQNEKIISLLEELVRGETRKQEKSKKQNNDDLVGGDMNGIL